MSAVTTAYLENHAFLKRFLTRFVFKQQDIEDIAQEAFLRAYSAEKRCEIGQPKAFLFRIARNVALTRLKKQSRQISGYFGEAAPSGEVGFEPGTDDQLEAQQSVALYCAAVAALPKKCREAFLLRKVHGLSHKEIAEHMSLSVSSVEKYLRSGVLACRDFVREREKGEQAGRSSKVAAKQHREGAS